MSIESTEQANVLVARVRKEGTSIVTTEKAGELVRQAERKVTQIFDP